MRKRFVFAAMILALATATALPAFAAEWKSSGKTRWFQYDDGTYPRDKWELIDGYWYYFDEMGYVYRGWHNIRGYWYYFDGEGHMFANTWVGNYYVGADGAMLADTWTPDGYFVAVDGSYVPEKGRR